MKATKEKGDSGRLRFELLIQCRDNETATALDAALMPDNRYFPKDQDFRATRDGHNVRFEIASPRVRPALTSVSSILSDAKLFEQVWVEAKTKGLGGSSSQ